jgi:hypothetical protein
MLLSKTLVNVLWHCILKHDQQTCTSKRKGNGFGLSFLTCCVYAKPICLVLLLHWTNLSMVHVACVPTYAGLVSCTIRNLMPVSTVHNARSIHHTRCVLLYTFIRIPLVRGVPSGIFGCILVCRPKKAVFVTMVLWCRGSRSHDRFNG